MTRFAFALPVVCGGLLASSAHAAPTQPGDLTNALVRTENCEYCHSYNNAPEANAEPSYAPYFSWRGSMMANAAVDPVFWAGVAVASQDALDPAETEACIRCHSPRAFLEGRGDAIAIDQLTDADRAGVECEFCHRMEDDGGIGNGQYAIDDQLIGDNVPRRGPWTYGQDGIPAPPHAWVQDTFIGSSEACGTCHDVTTERERVDDEGNAMGRSFNEQRTYSEWAGSAFAQAGDDFRSCQDCHMPAVSDMPGCRDHVEIHHHESGGRRHDMVGANRFVVELLAEDATVFDSIAFTNTLAVMDSFIQTAASLEVQGPESVDLGQGLDLSVTVTNETGHKLPTGYSEGRVMWIEVTARFEDEVVWSSGLWDAEGGLPTPEDDTNLRTYQGVADAYATGETLHLLRNDHWVEDTRIPPRGLTPDVETDPVGDRYTVQADGTWPHFDVAPYAFEGIDALSEVDEGELEVGVRLLYLVNTPAYIDFLAAENVTNDAGNDVQMLFDAAGGATPMVLAEQTVVIPVSAGGGSSTTAAGSTTGSDTQDSTTGAPASTSGVGSDSGMSGSSSSSSGAEPQDGGTDGCGCRSDGQRAPGAWLLVGLVALTTRRRRR